MPLLSNNGEFCINGGLDPLQSANRHFAAAVVLYFCLRFAALFSNTACLTRHNRNAGWPPLFPLFVVMVSLSTLAEGYTMLRFYDVTLLR